MHYRGIKEGNNGGRSAGAAQFNSLLNLLLLKLSNKSIPNFQSLLSHWHILGRKNPINSMLNSLTMLETHKYSPKINGLSRFFFLLYTNGKYRIWMARKRENISNCRKLSMKRLKKTLEWNKQDEQNNWHNIDVIPKYSAASGHNSFPLPIDITLTGTKHQRCHIGRKFNLHVIITRCLDQILLDRPRPPSILCLGMQLRCQTHSCTSRRWVIFNLKKQARKRSL